LLAQSSDQQAYADLCSRIVRQFGKTTDPTIAERMAKDCLIASSSGTDLNVIAKMIDTALAAGPNHKLWDYFQFVKGLAEYRQGRFASAAQWLQKVTAHPGDPYRTVSAHLVLAMARRELNQPAEARASLDEGVKIAETRLAKVDPVQWNDQLSAQLLMREARALVEGGANRGENK
jgi:hypothetical protein